MLKRINQQLIKTSHLLQPYQLRRKHLVSYDGFNLPVSIIGQGKPVLMVHAFGMDPRQFLPFILPLATQFCFYLPHLRGWGLSAASPTTEFDFIEQYVSDIEILIDDICNTHHTRAIDVAAISMGALVMWAYFKRYPSSDKASQVRRFLNIDQSPIVHNQPDWQGGVFGTKQDKVFAEFRQVLQATLPYLQNPEITEFSHLPYTLKQKIIEMETAFSLLSVSRLPSRLLINSSGYQPAHKLALYRHPTWQQKLKGLHAYLELPYDYRDALAQTQIPVTMLVGGHSQLYDPKWQYKVAELLANAKVIEIAESGHAIPLDAPLQFSQVLKQFLMAD